MKGVVFCGMYTLHKERFTSFQSFSFPWCISYPTALIFVLPEDQKIASQTHCGSQHLNTILNYYLVWPLLMPVFILLTHGSPIDALELRSASFSHGFVVYPNCLRHSSWNVLSLIIFPISYRIFLRSPAFFFLSINKYSRLPLEYASAYSFV